MFKITCLVENTAKRSSKLWGEHGISFLIESPEGTVLFDTGQSGTVLLHNAEILDIDWGAIDSLVFSHTHYDHTGGLESCMSLLPDGITLYGHPTLFRNAYSVRGDDERYIAITVPEEELKKKFSLSLSEEPQEILAGIWTTGEIKERPFMEGRGAQHQLLKDGEFIPDHYRDDLSLVLEDEESLILVCGCCHAGLLNTLSHIRGISEKPVRAILGGTHLVNLKDDDLDVVAALLADKYLSPDLYLNHCTGERALIRLAHVFGEKVNSFPAGSIREF